MATRAGRVLIATAACLFTLNGCETSTKLGDIFHSTSDTTQSTPAPADTTGTIQPLPPEPQPDQVPKGLLGNDPNDDLNRGKKYFRAADFGLAERHFRRADRKSTRLNSSH